MEKKKVPILRAILAANIKEERRNLGISQEKLAEMTGLSWQTVNSIECHRTWVSDKTLETIANALKIEPFLLLIPLETKIELSEGTTGILHKLAEAKKAYDSIYNEVFIRVAAKVSDTEIGSSP